MRRAGASCLRLWIGEWEVLGPKGKVAGRNVIEAVHGGCALSENWSSVNGGSGTSTNYFDPQKKLWVQNWIDANGSVIQLEGKFSAGSMKLSGRYIQADGTRSKMRGTWTLLDDGRVRQCFETSPKGKKWTPWFEGLYSRVN